MTFLTVFEIQEEILYLVIAFLIIIFLVVRSNFATLQTKNREYDLNLKNQQLAFQQIQMELRDNVNNLALAEFEKFKATELDGYKKRMDEVAIEAAQTMLKEWVIDEEGKIRKDAVKRSMSVNLGKISEHLLPFSSHFKQFNPKDARFLGSPIDLIVFDGVTDKKDDVNIYFIEVKTGNSALSDTQRKIWLAIERKNVHWLRINMQDFKWDTTA